MPSHKVFAAPAGAHLSFLLGAWAASGTGVPPVCSKPETHGRDTRATRGGPSPVCACSLCLAHPLQDHVRNVRFAADSRGVPHELSFFFSRIAPGGLAAFEPALHRFLRLTEHHRNMLIGM